MQVPSSHDKFAFMFTCKMIIINFADHLQARETAVAISSRNKSIVGAFGADVDPSDTDDGTAYLLYLSGIVGMKLGSRSKAPWPANAGGMKGVTPPPQEGDDVISWSHGDMQ